MTLFIALVLIPSAYLFYRVIEQSAFSNNVRQYIDQETHFERTSLIEHRMVYDRDSSKLDLFFIGEELDSNAILLLEDRLMAYGIENTTLEVHQSYSSIQRKLAGKLEQQSNQNLVLEEMFAKNQSSLRQKDSLLQYYQSKLNSNSASWIEAGAVLEEVKIQYPKLESYSLGRSIYINTEGGSDSLPILHVEWKNGLSSRAKRTESEKLRDWLEVRLKLDSIVLLGHY